MDSQDITLKQDAQQPAEAAAPEVQEVAAKAETSSTPQDVAEAPAAAEPQTVAEEVVAAPQTASEEATAEEAPAAEQATAEEASAAEQATAEEQPSADAVEEKRIYSSKKEVVERISEIAHGDDIPQKDEVERLKVIFYRMHLAEREADMNAYLESGGDPDAYVVAPDDLEAAFKAEMGIIRERRTRLFLEQEQERQRNLSRKLAIIEQIKAMATTPDEAGSQYAEFKRLQQEWNTVKNIPAERAAELWRNYQHHVEQYYDLLKLNSEAREYDFKKNLETKTHLCEAAERLGEESDVVSAFHQLQKLHQEYRETGPVSKELREGLWARFKAASTVVNKRHQAHFEQLRSREEENLALKTALCEKLETIAKEEPKTVAEWDSKSKEIMALQAEWKSIGFAPQKMNVKIFDRFRAACDDFFGRKAAHYKQMKRVTAANVEKKRALVKQAQELQDSTDWKATAERMTELQKEWRTTGHVAKKTGDKLWADFMAACNHFFEARKAANGSEFDNLAQKRDIVAQIEALVNDETADNLQQRLRELTDKFNAIGHVPFREKDALYAAYREALDKAYGRLNMSPARRRYDKGKPSNKPSTVQSSDPDTERTRLARRYEAMKQEIQTYENNIGFLNASSKKGNSLIDDLNRKVQKLKDEAQQVLNKIKAIDAEA